MLVGLVTPVPLNLVEQMSPDKADSASTVPTNDDLRFGGHLPSPKFRRLTKQVFQQPQAITLRIHLPCA